MNRDEILKRSQQENKNGDERDRAVRLKSQAFSVIICVIVGIILYVVNRSAGIVSHDIMAMIAAILFGATAYEAIASRKVYSLILSLVWLVILVDYLYRYISQVL